MTDYRREFSRDFILPRVVLDALESGELLDQSWHNDICPSFSHRDLDPTDDYDLRLWVDHAEPDQREYGPDTYRYLVTELISHQLLFATDDIVEALNELRHGVAMYLGFVHYTKTDNRRPACEGYVRETIPDSEYATWHLHQVSCPECQELTEVEPNTSLCPVCEDTGQDPMDARQPCPNRIHHSALFNQLRYRLSDDK